MKDTQVRGGYVLHVGSVEGCLKVGDKVTCTIDGVSEMWSCDYVNVSKLSQSSLKA